MPRFESLKIKHKSQFEDSDGIGSQVVEAGTQSISESSLNYACTLISDVPVVVVVCFLCQQEQPRLRAYWQSRSHFSYLGFAFRSLRMLSAELTSTPLLNASYQRINGLTKGKHKPSTTASSTSYQVLCIRTVSPLGVCVIFLVNIITKI